MVRIRVVMAVLALGLLGGAARAGVYDLDDPVPQHLPPLPLQHADIQLILGPLRAAAVPRQPKQDPGPYEKQAAALEAKAPGDRTTFDSVDLGACYIRLNRPNDAIRVLLQADQSNFLVLANLAAAYQSLNELDRALAFEEQALAAWPSIQPGWNGTELRWYRRAEGFYLKLLESRQRESQANPANKPPATMDVLFGKPRSAAGDYEAQEQPWKLWGDLPPDAYAIVSQLLVWSPNDDRLYWQLGELLNTMGLVPQAVDVFDELSFTRNFSTRVFMEHRHAQGVHERRRRPGEDLRRQHRHVSKRLLLSHVGDRAARPADVARPRRRQHGSRPGGGGRVLRTPGTAAPGPPPGERLAAGLARHLHRLRGRLHPGDVGRPAMDGMAETPPSRAPPVLAHGASRS